MGSAFEKLKAKFSGKDTVSDEFTDDFVELSPKPSDRGKARVIVRPFVIEDFADIKPALDAVREGYTIALLNIRPLKDKDLVELKRAVGKLKKTCEAVEGDIAGFGEDWLVVTPSFAAIYRGVQTGEVAGEDQASQQQ
ncbi:cell division protein SepF [Candidatus Woesearchaeota archaeon]|nr:cell division protein SepF [Candidatus Woesearchaeota archaeon]